MVRRSEALRPRGKLCPIHSRRHMPVHLRRQGRAHECFGMAAAGTAWIPAVMRSNTAVRPSPQDRRGRATGEDAAQTHCRRSASNRTQDLIPTWGCALRPADASPNATMTSVCAGQRGGGAPRRNRTADPILTMNHQEPLCAEPFSQGAPDRKGRSYRFTSGQVMRSLTAMSCSLLEQHLGTWAAPVVGRQPRSRWSALPAWARRVDHEVCTFGGRPGPWRSGRCCWPARR
jgi:hypothetical protein